CNRGLRRHRDRFRSQLPAVAQRRGRDPVGCLAPVRTRRARRRHRRPSRPAVALPGRARVAGAARRHAGAAPALGTVRHPRHRARLRLRSRAAGPIRRRRAGGAGRDHPRGGAPRPVRAWVHRHAGRLLRQHVAAAVARAHAPRPLRRALRRVGAAACGRSPLRAVRAGVGDGAAGGAGPGPAAARLALAAPEPDRAEPGAGNGAAGDVAVVACLLAAAAQVRRRSGRGGGRPGSSEFWRRIGDAWTGSSYVIVWLALAAAALAGLVMLAMRDRRAALILGVWLVQPIVLLSILTATSPDFAPERHLSFMIPAYVAALATFLVEVGRRAGRYGPWLAALLTLAAITPGVVALSRDVGNFTPDLRHASLALGSQFGSDDVLLSTGGVPEPGVD